MSGSAGHSMPLTFEQTPAGIAAVLRQVASDVESGTWAVESVVVIGDSDAGYGYRSVGLHTHATHVVGMCENALHLIRNPKRKPA